MSAIENLELKEKNAHDNEAVHVFEADDKNHASPRLKRELKPRHIASETLPAVLLPSSTG